MNSHICSDVNHMKGKVNVSYIHAEVDLFSVVEAQPGQQEFLPRSFQCRTLKGAWPSIEMVPLYLAFVRAVLSSFYIDHMYTNNCAIS
jgi:hypothetical protein